MVQGLSLGSRHTSPLWWTSQLPQLPQSFFFICSNALEILREKLGQKPEMKRAAGPARGGPRAAAEAAVRALAFPAEICLESLAWALNSHAATDLGSRMALKRAQNLIWKSSYFPTTCRSCSETSATCMWSQEHGIRMTHALIATCWYLRKPTDKASRFASYESTAGNNVALSGTTWNRTVLMLGMLGALVWPAAFTSCKSWTNRHGVRLTGLIYRKQWGAHWGITSGNNYFSQRLK